MFTGEQRAAVVGAAWVWPGTQAEFAAEHGNAQGTVSKWLSAAALVAGAECDARKAEVVARARTWMGSQRALARGRSRGFRYVPAPRHVNRRPATTPPTMLEVVRAPAVPAPPPPAARPHVPDPKRAAKQRASAKRTPEEREEARQKSREKCRAKRAELPFVEMKIARRQRADRHLQGADGAGAGGRTHLGGRPPILYKYDPTAPRCPTRCSATERASCMSMATVGTTPSPFRQNERGPRGGTVA